MAHILLAFVVLALPALSHATPCMMSMPDASQRGQYVSSSEMQPCLHHQADADHASTGMMSVSECFDLNMLTASDATSLKMQKADVSSVAIVPTFPWKKSVQSTAAPRSPPERHLLSLPQVALILKTQRFRV